MTGVTGVVTPAGEDDFSSGGGKVGIFSMTEGGESERSASLSGSESWPGSEASLYTLFLRVERGMP